MKRRTYREDSGEMAADAERGALEILRDSSKIVSFPELSSVQNLGLEVRLKKSLECFNAYKRCPLALCGYPRESCWSGFALLC